MTRELAEPLLEPGLADVLRFADRCRMSTYIAVWLALYVAVLWFVVYPRAADAAGTRCALLLTAAAVLVPCVGAVLRAVSVRRSWARVSVQPATATRVAGAKQEGTFARAWAEAVRWYRGERGAHSVTDLEAALPPPTAAPATPADFVERELVIDAPASTVFDAMVDFDSLPQWAQGINQVFDETPPGSSRRVVRFNAGVMGLSVEYTLAYTLVRPTRVAWVSVAGAVKRIVGEYRLTPVGPGSTRVHYRLEVDAGFSIPGPVRRAVNGLVVGAALPALKRHVEGEAHARLALLRKGPAEEPGPGWVKCRDGGFVRAPLPPGSPPTPPPEPGWVKCRDGGFVRAPLPPGPPPTPPPSPPGPPPAPSADLDAATFV